MRLMTMIAIAAVTGLSTFADVSERVKIAVDSVKIDLAQHRENGPPTASLPVSVLSKDVWLRIAIEYTIEPINSRAFTGVKDEDLYLDELEFDWSVVIPCEGTTRGQALERESVMFEKTVTYADVPATKDHRAVMYIDAKTYQRYREKMLNRDLLYIRLAIKAKGKTKMIVFSDGKKMAASREEPRGLFSPTRAGWFHSEDIRRAKGGLLSRRQTPWAWSSNSFYEAILEAAE
ncbi:MAG: hypothetical protein ACI8W8_004292 [Rhodothermales bacterium]|jgi:hypothetical protein